MALDLCSEADIRSKVLVILITFIVVDCYWSWSCVSIVFYFCTVYYLSCLSTAYGEKNFIIIITGLWMRQYMQRCSPISSILCQTSLNVAT